MNDFCDEQDVEILSELFRSSEEPRPGLVNGETAIDALYREAVRVAEEMDWPVPSREEFEEQYGQEIEKLRHE